MRGVMGVLWRSGLATLCACATLVGLPALLADEYGNPDDICEWVSYYEPGDVLTTAWLCTGPCVENQLICDSWGRGWCEFDAADRQCDNRMIYCKCRQFTLGCYCSKYADWPPG